MYDAQLLKTRIIDLVDSLPEDGLRLLAEFTNFLRLKYNGFGEFPLVVPVRRYLENGLFRYTVRV